MVAPCADPCGMAVEMLRTPFTQRVKPYHDRPDLECDIVWYPALPGAKCLPFPTAFNSNLFNGDWWRRGDLGPVGYVGFNNWQKPKVAAHGQFPCITPEEALNGFAYDPDVVCHRRPDGLLDCCTLEIVATGGARMGTFSPRIVARGGALGGGSVHLWPMRGGGRSGGAVALWATRGGALGGGRADTLVSLGGGLAGGSAPLVPVDSCTEVEGGSDICDNVNPFGLGGEFCLVTDPVEDRFWTCVELPSSHWDLELIDPTADTVVEVYRGFDCDDNALFFTLTESTPTVGFDTGFTFKGFLRVPAGLPLSMIPLRVTVT